MLEHWNKVHLLGVLSASLGLDSYLEITTTMTGGRYGEARALSFEPCTRLVYRIAASPSHDGLPVDFASDTDDIAAPLFAITRQGLTFDIILLDAHHSYACATRDLAAAYSLLKPGGAIVVHDCNPPTREIAAPDEHGGAWCGVTYKSFIDFTLGNPAIDYFTVDADWGCGVIIKPHNPQRELKNQVRARRQAELVARWSQVTDFDAAYTMFDQNRQDLLRLVDFGGLRRQLLGAR